MNKGFVISPIVLIAVIAVTLVWNPQFVSAGNATNDTGNIYATSSPSGASIYLDGAFKGTSPILMTNVFVGNHTVIASKTGYQTQSKIVAVYRNQTTNVDFSLTILCSDTDTSTYPTRNPAVRGTATTGNLSLTDFCIDVNTLKEYYCVTNTSTTISNTTYLCDDYCINGTCV